MNNKEMLYIKQNGECYIDKDCKWSGISPTKLNNNENLKMIYDKIYYRAYDENNNFVGIYPKEVLHSKDISLYHETVWMWITDETGRVLIQKRAATKKFLPGKWDISCAGHIELFETPECAAARELEEELGLDMARDLLQNEKMFKYKSEWLHEFSYNYFMQINSSTTSIRKCDAEVGDVKFVTLNELQRIIFSEDFVPHDIEYKRKVLNELKSRINKDK